MELEKTEISTSQFNSFLKEMARLNEYEFVGLTKVLSVRAVMENGDVRPFEDIFRDLLENFLKLNRKQRRNLLKIMKKANHKNIDFDETKRKAAALKEGFSLAAQEVVNGTQDSQTEE